MRNTSIIGVAAVLVSLMAYGAQAQSLSGSVGNAVGGAVGSAAGAAPGNPAVSGNAQVAAPYVQGNVPAATPNVRSTFRNGNANAGINTQGGVNAGIGGNAAAVQADSRVAANIAGDNRPDQWRYRYQGGHWWYWTPQNHWMWDNNGQWMDYQPSGSYTTGYGSYDVSPSQGYYYSYPSYGYGGYDYSYPGYWYGGGYYGRPGISVGVGPLGVGVGVGGGWRGGRGRW